MGRFRVGLWVFLFGLFAQHTVASSAILTVTVSRANVRQGPGLTHRVIDTLPRAATFPVLKTQDGWHQIQLDDGRAVWIASSVVRLDDIAHGAAKLEKLGLVMVPIDGGSFIMGCQSGRDSDCDDREKPAHRVQVPSFEIGKYEVTQALWGVIMEENPSRFRGCPKCPVEQVSWDDIQRFLAKLNVGREGRYRLPTEVEWEYAARGGRQSQDYRYAGGNDVGSVSWYWSNSGRRTHSVGLKRANELGLHDMSGNVWEWVQDCWNGSYRGISDNSRTQEQGNCHNRTVRGGSWTSGPRIPRASIRSGYPAGGRANDLGFRISRTLTP